MPKTSGLLRSNDNEDLSRNDLFTVHKKAIYFGMFNFHRKEDHNNAKKKRQNRWKKIHDSNFATSVRNLREFVVYHKHDLSFYYLINVRLFEPFLLSDATVFLCKPHRFWIRNLLVRTIRILCTLA